jgi:hypothetical protein
LTAYRVNTNQEIKGREFVSITDLFRRKVSSGDFVVSWLAAHKGISRSLFSQFQTVFHYKNDLDKLLSFKETEYLVFWFLRRHLNDATLLDMYGKFLERSKLSADEFTEQLEIRYRIYDDVMREFTESTQENTPSKQGIRIGQIVVKSIGNLDFMKNGSLGDRQNSDIARSLKAFTIWIEGIKMIDGLVSSAARKYRIEAFLRNP